MAETKTKSNLVPLTNICAVMCNYARPNHALACVRRLRKLGINDIIVWNNGAKAIPEASHNIIHPKNIGPIGKYLAALQTKKEFVLVVDDDHLLTKEGLNALRRWVLYYPAVAQNGVIFNPPYQNYNKRLVFQSHRVNSPMPVDMVQPNKGMMLKTNLYRRIPVHWAWKSQVVMDHRPGIFSTDLEVNCAIWDLTRRYPVVVPSKTIGFEVLKDEAPDKALCHQEGISREKTKIMMWLIAHGWKMIKS